MDLKKDTQEVRNTVSAKGEFLRKDAGYRNWIQKNGTFPPAKNRYHLYVSYACPWAHRTLIVRALKGLTNVIGLSIVHPTFQQTRPNEPHVGWKFSDEALKSPTGFGEFKVAGSIPDTINNFTFVRDIYESVNDQVGKYSVPVLYDTQNKQIVNNESSEIIQMFNSEFNEFAENPDLDLNPENLKKIQSEIDPDIYNNINNGVYRCGFAQSQYAYDNAVKDLFKQLDQTEERLSKSRYLTGNQLTLSDIRLWVTLVRFDEVYVVYFKTNKKMIHQYPNLLNYCRDIYQIPGVAGTLNMEHIKTHYYTSHPNLNYYAIIPQGCGFEEMLKEPHDREKFTKI